jgi:hypothetical protein
MSAKGSAGGEKMAPVSIRYSIAALTSALA